MNVHRGVRKTLPSTRSKTRKQLLQGPPLKRFQSCTLKFIAATLNISDIGKHPACSAGIAGPAVTAAALSLKGLK